MNLSITNTQLLPILQMALGRNVRIIDIETLKLGNDYLVLLVWLQHPKVKVIIKLAGPNAEMSSTFDRTAMLHQLVTKQTTLRMPQILAVNMSFQSWPWRYMIMIYTPGCTYAEIRDQMSADEQSDSHRQIGNAVAQLHAIKFPTFGTLAADGSVISDGPFLDVFTDHARRIIRKNNLLDMFLTVMEKQRDAFVDVLSASLCHEDLHGYNLLFQRQQGRWKLATVLDFDKAWAGHAEIDLARLDFWRGMTSPDFWQAYKEMHTVDAGYERRRPIYQLLWCFEYARSTAEHLADTYCLCKRYGFPCPEGFD